MINITGHHETLPTLLSILQILLDTWKTNLQQELFYETFCVAENCEVPMPATNAISKKWSLGAIDHFENDAIKQNYAACLSVNSTKKLE